MTYRGTPWPLDLGHGWTRMGKHKLAFIRVSSVAKTGYLVPCSPLQLTACLFLVGTAPLLEEERHLGSFALIANVEHPFLAHRPGAGPRFATDDDPVDVLQVEIRYRPQQRFDRQESY